MAFKKITKPLSFVAEYRPELQCAMCTVSLAASAAISSTVAPSIVLCSQCCDRNASGKEPHRSTFGHEHLLFMTSFSIHGETYHSCDCCNPGIRGPILRQSFSCEYCEYDECIDCHLQPPRAAPPVPIVATPQIGPVVYRDFGANMK
jgi:hypothetical protein